MLLISVYLCYVKVVVNTVCLGVVVGMEQGTFLIDSGHSVIHTCFVAFSELIAWYGMAVAGQHLGLYLAWLVMVCYLSGRSHQTQLWYQKKIENFPKDKRNVFPGIY